MTRERAPTSGWPARIGRAAADLVQRRPVVTGTVLVAVLLSGTIALIHPSYQSSDDPAMSLYAAGVAVRETPDAHLLFMHAWIGWLLKGLYPSYPDLPWYAILLYAVFAFASVTVVYALWRVHRTVTAFLLFLVMFLITLGTYAQMLQFTVLAMYCTAAGWLAAGARAMAGDSPGGRGVTPVALLALLLGASVRPVGFVMASLLCGPLLLYCLGAATPVGRRRLAVIGIAAGAGCALLNGLNVEYYRADQAWADFYEYNALRANFNDFQVIRYDARTRPAFDAAGWSRNDYLMIKNWFHGDAGTFSKEKMRQIVDAVGAYGTDVASAETARRITKAFATSHWTGAGVILAWIGAVWGYRRVWPVIATLATAAVLIGAVAVLLKPVPPRISMGIAGVCALVAAVLAAPRREAAARSRWRTVLVASMVAAVAGYTVYGIRRDVRQADMRYRQQRAFVADIALLAPRRSNLYVAWADAFPFKHIDPLAPLAYLRQMRILPLGAELHTPHVTATMERFGIADLYLALASRPNVYLISDDQKNRLYADYVREKYGLQVVLRPRFQGRTFVVYEAQPR